MRTPRLVCALFTVLALLGPAMVAPRAQAVTDPGLVDLGPAMSATDVGAIGAGPDFKGGGLVYVTTSGHPPTFTVLDAETNEVVYQQTMPGDEFVSSNVIDTKAGLTYFSFRSNRTTQIWVYDVATNTVEEVVQACRDCEIGEPVFRIFEVADDGTLYMASYPNASVYSYNPETKAVRNYGPAFTDGEYLWGLTMVGDQVFVGSGNGPGLGRLFQLDPVSGEYTQVQFAEGAQTPRVIGELQSVGSVVVVPMKGDANPIHLYDSNTGEWVCPGLQAPGFPQPTDAFDEDPIDGQLYFRSVDKIWRLDVAACSYTEVFDLAANGLDDRVWSGVKAIPTGPVDDPDLWRLITFATDGESLVINPADGTYELRESNVLPSPVSTHTVGIGPDGNLYVGAFLSPYVMGRLDPDTNELTVLTGPEQSDSTTTVGDHVVVTSYPGAVVHSGKVEEPWDWGTNPRKIFDGVAEEQDRIFEVVDADGLAVLGSIPKYGLLSGAITVLDPATGDSQIYRGIIGDLSVGALAYRGGVVYVGTTVHGGAGSKPDPAAEGMIATFDMRTRTITHSTVAVPGSNTVGGLAFGRGELWGMTDSGVLFRYDTRGHQVVETVAVPGAGGGTNWGRLPELKFNEADGLFYGLSATRQLFSFDSRNNQVRIIDDENDLKGLQVMPSGRIYAINETNIFYYDPIS
ncbi:hypothetical protein ACQBAU_12205 [Propionibacteriaceae bacterium Y2011]